MFSVIFEVQFQDYYLRVGEIVRNTAPPAGVAIVEQRLDETEIGRVKFVTLTEVQPESNLFAAALPDWLWVDQHRADLIEYEVFAGIYIRGKHALSASWRDRSSADSLARPPLPACAVESCPSSATTACSIDAKVLGSIPRSRPRRAAARTFIIAGHQEEPPC
jgi:hypothetical protein